MYITPSTWSKTFRDARANLSSLAHAPAATVILDRNRPIAILVPVDCVGMFNPGQKDRRLDTARNLFLAALEILRKH